MQLRNCQFAVNGSMLRASLVHAIKSIETSVVPCGRRTFTTGDSMPLMITQPVELAPLVGLDLPASSWLPMAQSRIDLFAEATGDAQWIHCDPQRAMRESPYGTTIAHGFLTLSLLPALLDEIVQFPGARMVVNYGLNRVRFPQAVPSDSRVRLLLHLLSAVPRGDSTELVCRCTIEVEGQSKPACVAELVLRVYF